MILSWRRRGAGRRAGKKGDLAVVDAASLDTDVAVPMPFQCPISLDLMKDPVTLPTGISYDRSSIERWIEAGNASCPVTKQPLGGGGFDLIPNHVLRKMIQSWCVENSSLGVERIPTPRIPASPYEVSEACKRIAAAANRGDAKRCYELVGKIKSWVKESERNKRCVTESGAGDALAAAFESFGSVSAEGQHSGLLEEIVSALAHVRPVSEEGLARLFSATSLLCILGFLNSDDLSSRQNAVLVLKEAILSDRSRHRALVDGIEEALVRMIREPIGPTATNASLVVLFNMISHSPNSDKTRSKLLQLDLVPLLINLLLDSSDKGVCERALGVLDLLCESREGMDEAFDHALTMPILVKKILRVSNLATDFAVAILWKLCKNEEGDDRRALIEAIQAGGFQKMLVLLQVDCGEGTKENARELLKLMNSYKDRVDCVDSSLDFKYLKRPY
ncbi:hypothetical protein BT93_L2619 [Corymbia citriodora subsp. variegata]|uniref:U-box domain-containing protein n=1 Tax=Corymbia citriodora subsp. variegata TaxID=360336 RepID=A0A8T0CWD0_CORYI|nr:hypothetical protein BT93_L2619 [Corymbia citriodora subsp. variegata]